MHSPCADTLIPIQTDSSADYHVVGAKACSLQRMMASGLAVPPALVLSTVFFEPWCSLVQRLPSWLAWRGGDPEQWPVLCAALKSDALKLPFTDEQQLVLDELLLRLAAHGASRFAVRSPSPDEDTASASFAGVYETRLGIAPAGLETAIRHCFAACLDYRVVAYKAAHGIDVLTRFSDGQLVEVDGTSGVVRVVTEGCMA